MFWFVLTHVCAGKTLQAKDTHVDAAKAFTVPALPSAPIPPNLATELAGYDATEPTRLWPAQVRASPQRPAWVRAMPNA